MILPSDRRLWPAFYLEMFEERAGIREHMGNVSREEAEKEADLEIRRLVERNFLNV